MNSDNELISIDDAENELNELKSEIDKDTTYLDYDYERINNKAQRILEWLRCVLSLGWAHNKISDDLNEEAMARRGARDGTLDEPQPSANAEEVSEIEQAVISHYQKLANRTAKVVEVVTGIIGCAFSSIDHLCALKGSISSEEDTDTVRKKLAGVQKSFRESYNYFKNFRYEHNLRRNVRYEPDFWNFISIIFIYLVFEVAINGLFYSKVADGLLEGWGIAATVAFFVVGLGVASGHYGTKLRGLSRINLPSQERILYNNDDDLYRQGWYTSNKKEWYKWRKHSLLHIFLWGIITLGFAILGIIVIFFAYIYRDAAEFFLNMGKLDDIEGYQTTIAIMAEAVTRLVELELQPQSGLSALALIVVNGLGGMLSFYKYHFILDDCIPGYAEAARDLKKQREKYKEMIRKVDPSTSSDLSESRGIMDKTIENRVRELETFIMSIRNGTDALKKVLPTLTAEYTKECNNILTSYREANKRARPSDDKEGPAYFNKFEHFPSSPDLKEIEEEYRKLCTKIDDVNINEIIRGARKWKINLIKEHLIEAEKDEGIELTQKEEQGKHATT